MFTGGQMLSALLKDNTHLSQGVIINEVFIQLEIITQKTVKMYEQSSINQENKLQLKNETHPKRRARNSIYHEAARFSREFLWLNVSSTSFRGILTAFFAAVSIENLFS